MRPQRLALGRRCLNLWWCWSVVGVLFAMAAPNFKNSFSSVHLSSATSAVSGAIQSTRYRAVVSGCQYRIVFSQSTITYQLTAQALTGTPASCPTNEAFTNAGAAVPWSGDGNHITLQASTTLQFHTQRHSHSGERRLDRVRYRRLACLRLSNGSTTTSTINVSGVGNVTVTSP